MKSGSGIPDWVDAYEIVGVLGEGGMGTVYRARQSTPVQREVALKILKLGMDTEQVVARFRAERQALAVMSHPSVAKVYDAGATETGRPYFVMELVEGVPVDEFCDRERLDVRERVRLCVRICRAVQHAHQKGVIHRDLKPSNILVARADGEPLPKIIDFGIARAIEETEDGGTRLTRLDQTVGTPAYMSPEQIDREAGDIDTRADIYSLGVILYQLLTGGLPFEAGAGGSWALFAKALFDDAPRPSTRVAALSETQQTLAFGRKTDLVTLRRDLRGDLDWIVLKALEKDRERRYETANGMALDLERYLSDQPVLARPPSASYRTSKFVRRHKIGVAFSVASVVALAGFGVIQTAQAERIRRARDLADARRGQAEGLIDYMLSDLRGKLEPLGRLEILDDVGAQAMIYFAALPVEEFSDDELSSHSKALYQIGQVRLDQGNLPSADSALQESLRLSRALSERDPADSERLFELGQAEFWVGELGRRRGDLDVALARFAGYRDISATLAARDSTRLDWRMEVGYSHTNVGSILLARGDAEAAATEFRRALAIKKSLVESDPTNRSFRFDQSRSHNALGIALMESGRLEEAREEFQTDVALKEDLLNDAPNATYTNRLAASLAFLGSLLEVTGQPEVARKHILRELVIDSSLVAGDPTNARWRRNLAYGRMVLGRIEHGLGNPTGARQLLSSALDEFLDLVAGNPDQPTWTAGLGDVHRHLAALELSGDNLDGARAQADRALAVLRSLSESRVGDRDTQRAFAEALVVSGDIEQSRGQPDRAQSEWREAVGVLESMVEDSRDWQVLSPWVRALIRLGEWNRAQPHLDLLREAGYRSPWIEGVEPG